MTIKLMLLKSGEDIISDITEMAVGDEDDRKVVGYLLTQPCIIKIKDSQVLADEGQNSFRVSLFPWMPLSKDKTIPVPADWVVTIVEPKDKLKEMYVEDVVNHGQNNQSDSADEQSDSDQSN